jgi:hypothetical protein
MSIKREVINESISRINSRLEDIDKILDANPLSDIIELRLELKDKMHEYDHTDPEFTKWLKSSAKKEKEFFKLADLQTKETGNLINEKVKLQMELSDLNNELWRMDQRGIK